jgi:hypothetical protein
MTDVQRGGKGRKQDREGDVAASWRSSQALRRAARMMMVVVVNVWQFGRLVAWSLGGWLVALRSPRWACELGGAAGGANHQPDRRPLRVGASPQVSLTGQAV